MPEASTDRTTRLSEFTLQKVALRAVKAQVLLDQSRGHERARSRPQLCTMQPEEPIEILIVEDSPTQAAQLRMILERHHFRVRVAGHGGHALVALQTHLPRLVISDILMPEMDGYTLCQRIKSDDRLRHLPVILLTSLSDLKDVVKGLECAADSFVVKPYEEHHLLSRIEYILANEKLRAHRTGEGLEGTKLELYFGGHSHFLARLPKVENAIDLLLGAYETLVEKNAALTQAKEEADRASRAKSEFLSRMSHELRTPMNAVLGFAQFLEMDETDRGKRDSLQQILNGGRHLLSLIDEVLDIAKIEAGRLSISSEPVRVQDAVQECLELILPLARTRRIRIDDHCAAAGARHVQADRQRLKQVILNLVSNAVKYNRDGGAVTLSCAETPAGRLRIEVSDTGRGIAAKDLPRLFAAFERLEAEGSGTDGTGLGLALSKKLVELMSGTIGVESVVGQGSVFWVELALANDPASQVESVDVSDPPPAAGTSAPSRTVLYIEDNLSNLKLIERLLARRPGVRLISAALGSLGLELARQHRPDLILLDLHLPDLPGREVLARLQADPATSHSPVVVVSADATPGEIGRLRSAGARDYLTKPLDVRQFLAVVDDVLQRESDSANRTLRHPAPALQKSFAG
jgi:signal transduction histidine kinase